MEEIVGGILLLSGVVILLWLVFIVLKNIFGFSSIPKKINEHKKQSDSSLNPIVMSDFRLEEKKEVLVKLDLNTAEINRYRFVRQSMLEEESRDGYDLNSTMGLLAFGLLGSKYRNYEKEETLWTRYGNAELYEVKIPCSFENYDLVFSVVFGMDKDTLAIHLALEKELELIITCNTYELKESVVILNDIEVVKSFKEFDVTYKFAFQSDSKYKYACLGDWITIVAIDGVPVEEI